MPVSTARKNGRRQHAQVDADIRDSRDVRRHPRPDDLDAAVGEHHADDGAGDREHDAFDQEPADEAPATGAERRANPHLAARPVARTSIRLATLAQAMSSTSPTAPRRSSIHGRTRPTRW